MVAHRAGQNAGICRNRVRVAQPDPYRLGGTMSTRDIAIIALVGVVIIVVILVIL